MDDLFDTKLTAQAFEFKAEGDQFFEDYQSYRAQSFNTLADGLVSNIKESLPFGHFSVEMEMYCRILLDNLDLANQKKAGVGLIHKIDEAEIGLYEVAYDRVVNPACLEATRIWMMKNSPYFGLGCQSVREYHSLLLGVKAIPKTVLYRQRLVAIRDLVAKKPNLKKVALPSGVFDPKHGFYPQ